MSRLRAIVIIKFSTSNNKYIKKYLSLYYDPMDCLLVLLYFPKSNSVGLIAGLISNNFEMYAGINMPEIAFKRRHLEVFLHT